MVSAMEDSGTMQALTFLSQARAWIFSASSSCAQ